MSKVTPKQHIIIAYAQNNPGVLNRVTSMFRRKRFNIESLTAGYTEKENISQMTIVVDAETTNAEQLKKQLYKIVDVVKIIELESENAVVRELVIMKIHAPSKAKREEVRQLADLAGAKVSHIDVKTLTIELCDQPTKIHRFIELMEHFGIKELIRTGLGALRRT